MIYQENLPLDPSILRTIRQRLEGFRPLLRDTTDRLKLACTEVVSAFITSGGKSKTLDLRVSASEEAVRIEMLDSLDQKALFDGVDEEHRLRLAILNTHTARWGVVGDGKNAVWVEVDR